MTPEEEDQFWNEVPEHPMHYDRLGVPISLREAAELWEDPTYRNIAKTVIADRWLVSTVWLGVDHLGTLFGGPPIIFETMVFDHGPDVHGLDRAHDYEQQRYSTEAAARDGHEQMVQLVQTLEGVTGRVDQ